MRLTARIMIGLNLAFALYGGHSVYRLHQDLQAPAYDVRAAVLPEIRAFERPQFAAADNWPDLLAVEIPPKPEELAPTPADETPSLESLLNEWIAGETVLRLQGVFSRDKEAFAVVQVGHRQTSETESLLVRKHDIILNLVVKQITSGTLVLENRLRDETLHLKIFARET